VASLYSMIRNMSSGQSAKQIENFMGMNAEQAQALRNNLISTTHPTIKEANAMWSTENLDPNLTSVNGEFFSP